VNYPSVQAVIELVNEAMRAYSYASACKPQLTNTTEVQSPIRGLKVCKAPDPDGIPNGFETFSTKGGLPPGRAIQRDPLYSILAGGLELHSRVLDPEAWERSCAVLILLTRKSVGHDWLTVRENSAL
jgi:hypothetical protein